MNLANEIITVKRHRQLEKLLQQVIADMADHSEIIREIHPAGNYDLGAEGPSICGDQKVSAEPQVQEVLYG